MATTKKYSAALAVSMLLLLPLSGRCATVAPAVLSQAAILSPKALNAAMLAIANAGSRLVAAGERGVILWSDDAGKSWQQAVTPVQVSLVALQFVNPTHGWAVGHLGVVLHTGDGGKTWHKQLDGILAAQLAARAASGPQAQAAAQGLIDDGPDKPFLDLYFENERSGYIVGAYNLMFKTEDGGASWQAWQAHVPNPKSFHLYGIRAAGDALYLAGEQGLLFRSGDRGQTFEALASPYKGSYFGLLTAASGEVLAFGLRGNVFRSSDQGRSWSKVQTGIDVALASGIELADGTLVLLSQAGDVLLSRDKGQSFRPQPGKEALPLAAIAQARDATLVAAGLRGVKRLAAPAGP